VLTILAGNPRVEPVPRELRDLGDLAARAGPPAPALSAIVELRILLEELEEVHVAAAREQGWSWSEIAAALGVTRQAAHKKHARRLKEREDDSARARAAAGTSGASRNLDP
jgi:hypothetical protein